VVLLSVVLCAHNPRVPVLRRVIRALAAQTLPKESWELVVVDNRSSPPVAELMDRAEWGAMRVRFVGEPRLGLTRARLAGFHASDAEVLVLIDDDTLPDPDYLERALGLMTSHPEIGAAGGRIEGEFESPPPRWAAGYLDCLAIRDFGDRPIRALIYNECGPWEPCGAGMVLRRSVARTYSEAAERGDRIGLDRVGGTLSSCGDTDLARTSSDLGLFLAYEPSLNLKHVIPGTRLRLSYLLRLTYSIQRDGWFLFRLRGRRCRLSPGRALILAMLAPIRMVVLPPQRWLLRVVATWGQIRGRSVRTGGETDV